MCSESEDLCSDIYNGKISFGSLIQKISSLEQTSSKNMSHFSPFLTKLFHSDAVMSSGDVCAMRIMKCII